MPLSRQQGGELRVPTARCGQAGAGDPAPELHLGLELVDREVEEHRHPANLHAPSLEPVPRAESRLFPPVSCSGLAGSVHRANQRAQSANQVVCADAPWCLAPCCARPDADTTRYHGDYECRNSGGSVQRNLLSGHSRHPLTQTIRSGNAMNPAFARLGVPGAGIALITTPALLISNAKAHAPVDWTAGSQGGAVASGEGFGWG